MKRIFFTTTIVLLFVSCTVTKQEKADNTSYQHTIDNAMQTVSAGTAQTETQKDSKVKFKVISSFDSLQKNELVMTPEMTEMMINAVSTRFNDIESDEMLVHFGVTNRSQLMSLQLGKPIPVYYLTVSDTLKFIDRWRMLVMSDNDPLIFVDVRLTDDEQYRQAGGGGAAQMAGHIYNYKYKGLIIGYLIARASTSINGIDYLYIQKDNKDIFVEVYDYSTQEWFKNEYSLSEIINLRKK